MTETIKCRVIADKVWYSKESRILVAGDIVEFPAQVKNHEGELVDFKVGDSFELVEDEKPAKNEKPAKGSKPAEVKPEGGDGLV